MKSCLLRPLTIALVIGGSAIAPAGAATVEAPWLAPWIGRSEASGGNTWLCFRKQVTLDAVPKSAPVRIACDSKYWLWVNGELVVFEGQLKRGPTPQDTYYDEVNLAPHLRQGENTIAVLLWYWGKPGFSHNSSGQAGLVFDAALNGKPLLSDKSWKVIRHPAFGNTDKPHPNFRLPEPNIQFDARQDIGSWMSPAFNDRAWPAAIEFGQPPVMPWGKLVRRPIPQWKNSGLRDYQNTSELPKESHGGVVVAQLPYNAHITPYLKVEAPAGLAIDIRTDNYVVTDENSIRSVYITREGVQEYESPGWMNGHQVRYTIPKGVKILALTYRETGYDADFAGRFDCDDPALNRLWEEARRTLYVTMRDTYMDCPDRERAQWWGDVVNELGESFYVFDFARGPLLAKKGILELAHWQRADGSLYAPVPAGGRSDATSSITTLVRDGTWNIELPMQMLASVGWYGFWTYYLYTGDRQTLAEVYPAVRSYLALWKLGTNGLAIHRAGEWDWPDWGDNADVAVLDNAWLYLALKAAVEMAPLTGHAADVPGYQEKMNAIAAAFNGAFWRGDHYHSPAHTGDTDDRANAMAVVAGLANPGQYPAIRRVLAEKTYASPYMEKYVLEALFLMGSPEQGLARMKARYAAMLHDHSTTLWENFGDGNALPGSGTHNHAWSGGFLTILSQYAAGLSPTTPGWKTFTVRPQLGMLNTVAASVSTATGDIRVAIQRAEKPFSIELDSPADTRATVCLPKPASGDWQRIRVNDAVVWAGNKAVLSAATPARHLAAEPQFHRLEIPAGHFTILAD
jgi:hypothetical protein